MRLIIASDSHGSNTILNELVQKHPEADYYLHCGDLCDDPRYYPAWIVVRGNNDYYGKFQDQICFPVRGHKILMVHSHRCAYFHREDHLVSLAKQNDCDIVCYGHTHRPKIEMHKDVLLINPGSVTLPRGGLPRSYAILDVDEQSVQADIIFLETDQEDMDLFAR